MNRKNFVLCLLISILFSCNQSGVRPNTNSTKPSDELVEFSAGDKKYVLSGDDISHLSYVNKTHLGLSLLSEKDNFQFMFAAYIPELKPGTYQVWDCTGPSDCDQEADSHNQGSLFAPYPKDPMPPMNLSRTAYNAPALGLHPLTLTITDVTNDQQAGAPFVTKRVKGNFTGTLAYVEKQNDDWKVVGLPTKIAGNFDLYCEVK